MRMPRFLSALLLAALIGTAPIAEAQIPALDAPLFAGDAPAFAVDFTQGVLPSTVAFSRGSNATQFSAAGRLTYAPHNLLTQSNQFDGASWAGGTATGLTPNAGTDPFGGNNAYSWSGGGRLFRNVGTVTGSHLNSIYIKTFSGSPSVTVVVKDNATDTVRSTVTVGTTSSWVRINSGVGVTTTAGERFEVAVSGGTALIYGAQAENVLGAASPGPYADTAGSAYFGPRFDYDSATGPPTAKGLLIEESRTNLALQSNQFDTTWGGDTAASVTAASGTSPDGSNNAWKLTENTTTVSQHRKVQNLTKAASALQYSFSVFAKAVERSRVFASITSGANGVSATFDLAGGQIGVAAFAFGTGFTVGSSSIQSVGAGWYRCTVVGTTDAATTLQPQIGIDGGLGTTAGAASYAGTIGSGILIYGAQLEQAAFPTSYIPTTTAAVTRAADVASIARSSFAFNPIAGTFAVEYVSPLAGPNALTRGELLVVNDNGTANRLAIRAYDTGAGSYPVGVVGDAASNLNIVPTNTQTAGVKSKVALSYGPTTAAIALNGVAATDYAKGYVDSGWTVMFIGNTGGSANCLNGPIARLRYFGRQAGDGQLQTLAK